VTLHPVRTPSPAEVIAATNRELPKSLKTGTMVAAIVGALIFIIGIFVDPDRAWRAFHFNWLFFAVLTQAGVTFVAVQRITTARWSRHVIRFMEGYVAFMPVAFVFLLLILFVGKNHIFWWTTGQYPVPEKAEYYNPAFLMIRDIVIFGLMTWLGLRYIYSSLRLDVGHIPEWGAGWAANIRAKMRQGFGEERRELHTTHSKQGRMAVFMVLLFGMGWSVLSWDLSMGLSSHFQSTLYSWWFFMGGWLCALMLFALIVRAWQSHLDGANGLIEEVHFHDIGKLCFAFTAFWGYLTFGQYLVIWYGNMGEETHWMRLRLVQPWLGLGLVVIFGAFVLPFFGLLSRAAKVFLPTFILFAACSLVGLYTLRFLEVYPSLYPTSTGVPFGLWEIGVTLGVLGLWGFCYASFMNAFPRMRVTMMTSPYRDEVQVPVNPETMEPLPAHE
jgi:hypothetical protein